MPNGGYCLYITTPLSRTNSLRLTKLRMEDDSALIVKLTTIKGTVSQILRLEKSH